MRTRHLPAVLVDNLKSKLCIPWCGAGVSAGSGLPTWEQLVRRILAATKDHGLSRTEAAELDFLAGRGAFDDVVDFCRGRLGENAYRELLDTTFAGARAPSNLHRAVAGVRASAIFTTNYDRMLETALARATGDIPSVLTSRDTENVWRYFAKDQFFILKVHGDISRTDTVVLSRRDYTEYVFGNLAFMQFMQRILLSRSIVFIGTSLGDAYLRRILEENVYLTGGVGRPHFAFMQKPGQILSTLMRERYNITLIPYDTRQDLLDAVEQLREVAPRVESSSTSGAA